MAHIWIFTVLLIGLWHGASEASLCTARGRFPNENVPDCRGYTMCLSGAPGVFTQYDLTCPETFVYSHIDNQCTNITSYQCHPQFNCTSEGNFADETDRNCTKFISCINGLNDLTTARLVECPENTHFNSSEGACVSTPLFTCESQEPHVSYSNKAINLSSQYALLVCFLFCLVINVRTLLSV